MCISAREAPICPSDTKPTYHAAPHISFDDDVLFASASLGASFFSSTTRRVSAPGMEDTILGLAGVDIAGDQNERALRATARVGHHFDLQSLKASPYVFSRVARQHLGAVNETGTSIVTLDAASATAVTGELGLGMTLSVKPIEWNNMLITPSLNVAYGRRFGDFKRSLELLGSPAVSKVDLGKNRIELQSDLLLTNTASALEGKLSYRACIGSDAVSHTVSANFNVRF